MHFLVIGGSGRTGRLIIEEGLSRGHRITALVRSASSLAIRDKNLTIVEGSPLKESDIEAAFVAGVGQEGAGGEGEPTAVVVALAARRTSDSPFSPPSPDTPPRLMADSVANAIRVMRRRPLPCRRLVVMSSIGTGDSFPNLNFLMRAVFRHTNMRLQLVDHNAVDSETRAAAAGDGAGLDFVIVRPVMLAEGPAAEVRVFPDNGQGSGFMPKITRASVARFMVEALETDEYVGRSPVITN
ncbi:hypothetical protein BX600DRAFT_139315 [Xylariales sp. PMI_506]|nr:hypothetical protein BX600DRAFT_139315 [Xylariales sp. PMI_506]